MLTMVVPIAMLAWRAAPALMMAEAGSRTSGSAARSTLAHYEAHPFRPDPHDVELHSAFLSLIAPDGPAQRVLDVGCGPGLSCAAFQSAGHDVTGLDGCSKMARLARDASPHSLILEHDLHRPFSDDLAAEFDAVFAARSLFHVHRPLLPSVIYDLHGRLRRGGLFFSVSAHASGFEDVEDWGAEGDERYAHLQTIESWCVNCEAMGFVLLERYRWPPRDDGAAEDQSREWVTVWRRPS